MLKDLVEARALLGHRLYLRFEDDVEGEVDVEGLVEFKGIFALLRAGEEFAKVRVDPDLGTVCWPNGADLDSEVLYAALTGEPIDLAKAALPR